MKKQQQEQYLKEYKKAKEKGVPFFPDIIFKDAIASLLIFLVLVGLAYFVGAGLEERANPADTAYTPKPEWYFMFLYQALKYFPGNLEVVGAVVIPTIVILFLIALPFIDRSPKRNILGRPLALLGAVIAIVVVVGLTVASELEVPPPAEIQVVDPGARLYSNNCAGCHGPSITVETGTDLHVLIAEGGHEGMPAWGADLSADEIDLLVGHVTSPLGSHVFVEECAACHESPVFAIGNPLELQNVLKQGPSYEPHMDQDVPDWSVTLNIDDKNALLNFLAAPDGHRLFTINCSGCHGRGVTFEGTEEELHQVIAGGEMHREMPAYSGVLSDNDIKRLALFLDNPGQNPEGKDLFIANCTPCHGTKVPRVSSAQNAYDSILTGGAHQDMPIWGEILTDEQLDSLVAFTIDIAKGTGAELGQQIYLDNCIICHGIFGEGGPNPGQPGDIIAPISTAEYLETRDNITLYNIISAGQPGFGMSPFGSANGGPLEDDEINALVAFMRSWEANPPVDAPPSIDAGVVSFSGEDVFQNVCAECHGSDGKGGLGPSLNSPEFRASNDDDDLLEVISRGHDGSYMIAWSRILTEDQIVDVIDYINIWGGPQEGEEISFNQHILPLFQRKCGKCHGENLDAGGWRGDSYEYVMESGDNAPVILPGDPDNSLLVQKLKNIQTIGEQMPPARILHSRQIQWVIDWILAGALDN